MIDYGEDGPTHEIHIQSASTSRFRNAQLDAVAMCLSLEINFHTRHMHISADRCGLPRFVHVSLSLAPGRSLADSPETGTWAEF